MSFLFATYQLPLWFLLFVLACAAPLWIKWYQQFYRRFVKTGLLQRKLSRAGKVAEEKMDELKKAAGDWSKAEVVTAESIKTPQDSALQNSEQPYIKIVLKTLALQGDTGMLIPSIADKLEISSIEIGKALAYLETNRFVEAVQSASGAKYYLAARGRRYCIKRGYIESD